MSVLVTYGSSDDEDEPSADNDVQLRDATLPDSVRSVNGYETNLNEIQNLTVPVQEPMIGPIRPSDLDHGLNTYEDNQATTTNHLSEPDMLRLLTQPSHPVSSLPPEPEGQADAQVTAKLKKFLDLKQEGIHFNEDLANRGSFRNPNLFASLLERIGLSPEAQYATTLPSNVFRIDLFPSWAYKEELSKSQQAFDKQIEIGKRGQSAVGKRTIQFSTATNNYSEEENNAPELASKRTRI